MRTGLPTDEEAPRIEAEIGKLTVLEHHLPLTDERVDGGPAPDILFRGPKDAFVADEFEKGSGSLPFPAEGVVLNLDHRVSFYCIPLDPTKRAFFDRGRVEIVVRIGAEIRGTFAGNEPCLRNCAISIPENEPTFTAGAEIDGGIECRTAGLVYPCIGSPAANCREESKKKEKSLEPGKDTHIAGSTCERNA